MTTDIILAIAQIFGVCLLGWLAARLGYLTQQEIARWSHLVVDFLFPPLIFYSIIRGFEPDRMHELWPLPFLGLGIVVAGALSGIVLRAGVRSPDADLRRTFHHFCAANNYGFLPVLIAERLWGDPGVAKLFFFNLGSSIGFWTIGVALLGGADIRRTARNIITPVLVALLAALGICLAGLKPAVPGLLLSICRSAGAAAVPAMLLLSGATLYPLPRFENRRDLGWLTLCRLVLIPLLCVLGLLALPLAPDVRHIAFLVALMPVPLSTTVLTLRFGGSPRFAAQAAVFTTLAAAFTVPLAFALLQRFLQP